MSAMNKYHIKHNEDCFCESCSVRLKEYQCHTCFKKYCGNCADDHKCDQITTADILMELIDATDKIRETDKTLTNQFHTLKVSNIQSQNQITIQEERQQKEAQIQENHNLRSQIVELNSKIVDLNSEISDLKGKFTNTITLETMIENDEKEIEFKATIDQYEAELSKFKQEIKDFSDKYSFEHAEREKLEKHNIELIDKLQEHLEKAKVLSPKRTTTRKRTVKEI